MTNTRAYNRYYEYDRLGNMLQLSHVASGNTFNRVFNAYDSMTNPDAYETGNLANEIDYGGTTVNYTFDANGNMVAEGSSRHMEWDFGDGMRAYYTQAGTSEPSVYAHYLYGADGNRVKKVVRKSTGNEEVSVYIDVGFEYLYELNGTTRDEEMNEIQVMDGRSRIARSQVYGGTWSGSTSDPVLYNLEDHLGNSSFTLDGSGGEWSQEEYFPFGETSFGCYARKRYRFCGKERDSESGLYYYGARYYAPWGCRFVSVDPLAGKYPFYTPYQYAGNKPVNFIDLDGLEPAEFLQGNGKLTHPLVALLDAAFYSKSSLEQTTWKEYEDVLLKGALYSLIPGPSLEEVEAAWAIATILFGGAEASTKKKTVIYNSDSDWTTERWFGLIVHEQFHRNEIDEIGWVSFYFSYADNGTRFTYLEIPEEVRAYEYGLGLGEDLADKLWSFDDGIVKKLLFNSSYSDMEKAQKLYEVGRRFRSEVVIPFEIGKAEKELYNIEERIHNTGRHHLMGPYESKAEELRSRIENLKNEKAGIDLLHQQLKSVK